MPKSRSSVLAGDVYCILVSRMLVHTHGHCHAHIWTDDDDDDDSDGSESVDALSCPPPALPHLPRLFPRLYGHNDDGCVGGHAHVYACACAEGSEQVHGESGRVRLGLVMPLLIDILVVVLLCAGAGAGAGVCDNGVAVELGGLGPDGLHGCYIVSLVHDWRRIVLVHGMVSSAVLVVVMRMAIHCLMI